jgi:hypothetical protein
MNILRILLLILLFLVGRRLYRAFRDSSRPRVRRPGPGRERGSDPKMKDLTDQDISDADFEEIP